MLAVKAILAQTSKLPTLIFDEIDTGVSWRNCYQNGRDAKKEWGMQILLLHTPQIV
jgi:DNA repair protein RecN (Recombination protein N)